MYSHKTADAADAAAASPPPSSSSSSSGGGGKSDPGAPPATIDVRAIRVDAEHAGAGGRPPLSAALRLEIDFDSDAALRGAAWRVRFLVDVVSKRYIVELGEARGWDVARGGNSFVFSLDSVDVSRVKSKHLLNNAGLLIAALQTADGEDVIDINLVVQVSRSRETGELERYILNPLR
jgi:hypothetical protein